MWNIEKTVRVNPHAAAADSHSNKEKKRICWFWKRNCHDRPYSMSLTFRRPLYNVLVFLGSNDWRLFQRSQLSPRIWVPVFRPLRNSWFRWPTCLIQKDLLWHPPCWTSASICNVSVWTSATCQMLKWGHVNSLHGRAHARLRALTPAPHLMKAAQLESQGRHPGALCSRSPLIIQQQPCSLRRPGQRWSKNMQMFTFKSHIIRN